MNNNSIAVVLGSYLNSYAIIQELYEKKVSEIAILASYKKAAWYSNKINIKLFHEDSKEGLYKSLLKLKEQYNLLVIFPTDDKQIEYLADLYNKIIDFCFIPFNINNVKEYSDKYKQYKACERLNIPYPKTVEINSTNEIEKLTQIPYPILIKPTTRKDLNMKVFRSLELKNSQELNKAQSLISSFIKKGISFIASEIIPGDGSNIYAYTGYRNLQGKILNEWTGKKLSQFPNDYGIFASGSNEAPIQVLEQGQKLLNGMNLVGINEPEFKFDSRDGKYKLMEINLRSMMWHRVGNISGVNIQYTQWLDAIEAEVKKQNQTKNKQIKYIYLRHEIINLLTRKKYFSIFFSNLSNNGTKNYAMFDKTDLKPFIFDFFESIKALFGQWLKILKIRS